MLVPGMRDNTMPSLIAVDVWTCQAYEPSIGKIVEGAVSVEEFLEFYHRAGKPVRFHLSFPSCATT